MPLTAAGKVKIKVRAAMKFVGFTSIQAQTMSLCRKIRRKSQKIVVVDKSSVERPALPVPHVNIVSEWGHSFIHSLHCQQNKCECDSSNNIGMNDDDEDDDNTVAPIPRRLLATDNAKENNLEIESNRKSSPDDSSIETGSSNKSRSSSRKVRRLQAHVIMQMKKDCMAMKAAKTVIDANNKLVDGHPDKKSMNKIVQEANDFCGSNTSPKTAAIAAVSDQRVLPASWQCCCSAVH